MLSVSASGYYAWVDRPLSERDRKGLRIELEIKAADQRTRNTYSAERLQQDLAENGTRVGICRIRRIRKKLGIVCKQKKKWKATTDSNHNLPVMDNILKQEFKISEPDKVWVSDITYVPTGEGWLYLAGHKDLGSGEVVGYAMGERLTRNLTLTSLLRALHYRRPGKGLLHHSDRGSQYCSYEYRDLMSRYGLTVSMSGKGNCYDNAPMESFWGTLKQELIHHRCYHTRREAIADITEYIEVFYNRMRIQKRLGFLSPAVYARKYYAGLIKAG
jgi:putative transposase